MRAILGPKLEPPGAILIEAEESFGWAALAHWGLTEIGTLAPSLGAGYRRDRAGEGD